MDSETNDPKQRTKPSRRVAEHLEKFNRALSQFESNHPKWRAEALFWLIEFALGRLRQCIENPKESEITWESPFVELHYPVECNWNLCGEGEKHIVSLNSGTLTEANLVDCDTATRALSELLIKHITILALQDFTNGVTLEKRGNAFTPIVSAEWSEILAAVKSHRKRDDLLRTICRPFAVGAATLDVAGEDLVEGKKLPQSVLKQLKTVSDRIDVPALRFNGNIDGHKLDISLILQIHPLIADVTRREAYFPITVGLLIIPRGTLEVAKLLPLMAEPWANPSTWSDDDKREFWKQLFLAVAKLSHSIAPPPAEELATAIVKINATLKVPVSPGKIGEMNALSKRLIEKLGEEGEILAADYSVSTDQAITCQSTIPHDQLRRSLAYVDSKKAAHAKGKALEELMAQLFRTVPGFKVETNLRTETEEIDLWISNDSPDSRLRREEALIIGECKNWSSSCGKNEFVVFKDKMVNRKSRCSLGFLISWNGFAETITKEMLRVSHERLLIVPLRGEQVREAVEHGSFSSQLMQAWDDAVRV